MKIYLPDFNKFNEWASKQTQMSILKFDYIALACFVVSIIVNLCGIHTNIFLFAGWAAFFFWVYLFIKIQKVEQMKLEHKKEEEKKRREERAKAKWQQSLAEYNKAMQEKSKGKGYND